MADKYDDTIRAEALRRLLSGGSMRSIAKGLGISKTVIVSWRDKTGLSVEAVSPQKKEDLGALVERLLDKNLRGLGAIADLARDPAWLKRQKSSDIAIFYGVLADKSVRILGALRPVEPPRELTNPDCPRSPQP